MGAERLWKIDDVAAYVNKSASWVYKRTGPRSKLTPKIPKVANSSHPRFDPEVIKELFSLRAQPAPSSLKIEKFGNLNSKSTSLQPSKGKRRFTKL